MSLWAKIAAGVAFAILILAIILWQVSIARADATRRTISDAGPTGR